MKTNNVPEVISFDEQFYHPPKLEGLERLVRFPGSEMKNTGIPNSTVWDFSGEEHAYHSMILGNDVGCGMIAASTGSVDTREAANATYDLLAGKGVMGRGNHFVDFCDPIQFLSSESTEGNVVVIHTDGKMGSKVTPLSIPQAQKRTEEARQFRYDLLGMITNTLKTTCGVIGDWAHNTVNVEDGVIRYRKGCIVAIPKKPYMFPSHLSAPIYFYTVCSSNPTLTNSMPHASGRAGPRGDFKVSADEARKLRDIVYIPEGISDESLRTEAASCFNSPSKVYNALRNHIAHVGQTTIRSYVGKV